MPCSLPTGFERNFPTLQRCQRSQGSVSVKFYCDHPPGSSRLLLLLFFFVLTIKKYVYVYFQDFLFHGISCLPLADCCCRGTTVIHYTFICFNIRLHFDPLAPHRLGSYTHGLNGFDDGFCLCLVSWSCGYQLPMDCRYYSFGCIFVCWRVTIVCDHHLFAILLWAGGCLIGKLSLFYVILLSFVMFASWFVSLYFLFSLFRFF